MPNRTKTERNENIMMYADAGYRHASIARMFKMRVGTVSVVIHRERKKKEGGELQ